MALPLEVQANLGAIQFLKLNETRLRTKYPESSNLTYEQLVQREQLDPRNKKTSVSQDNRSNLERVKARKASEQELNKAQIKHNVENASKFMEHTTDYVPIIGSVLRKGEADTRRMIGDKEGAQAAGTQALLSGTLDLATLPFGLGGSKALLGSWIGGETGKYIGLKYDTPYLGQFTGAMLGGISPQFLNKARQIAGKGYYGLATNFNIYRKIPFSDNSYYRIVSDSHGDLASNAITDAEGIGIIRANPKGSWVANGERLHFIGPYFSKGKLWGSIPKSGKVIVGKPDLPGMNWMEINPHATELIEAPGSTQFTPLYKEIPNSAPTKYFHYYERGSNPISKHFWFRRDFKPLIDPTLTPLDRFRLGDVEINDPNLNYRLGKEGLVNDFFESGVVRTQENPEKAIERAANPQRKFLLTKSFSNPMFRLGSLWYDPELVTREILVPSKPEMLVTRLPLRFATKTSGPAKVDMGGRRIPFSPDLLNPLNTSAFVWLDGYGFRRVPQETTPIIKLEF